jgi:hypothetical protein
MNIVERFSKFLTYIEYPKEKGSWHISGIIPKFSNQVYKYDVRGMRTEDNGHLSKPGSTQSEADKMVFETDINWLIFDTEELHKYLYNNKLKIIHLDKMIDNLRIVWKIEKEGNL